MEEVVADESSPACQVAASIHSARVEAYRGDMMKSVELKKVVVAGEEERNVVAREKLVLSPIQNTLALLFPAP